MNEPILSIRNVCKKYSKCENYIFENASFDLNSGEILALVGNNGTGKSTLLRIIAGLEPLTSGTISYMKSNVKTTSKNILLLQQSTEQLFPWLNVKMNVVLPQVLSNHIKFNDAWKHGKEKLQNVGIFDSNLYTHYPSQLSGGQKQRVAIARALALVPKVIMLDEPFSAIDESSRITIGSTIKELPNKEGVSIILITHQIDEAKKIADRVIYMSDMCK